ncbi:DMT family transporter [Shimia sagamensis]|uniref:EamA-like transporter family protein n=1 Tax=Shimia sagamensis TaxID=1566352 RepID=A0ABY1P4P9_9RHOB|nr:DMT family transporter [Shimia sagamensis]SMP24896.1 EamA-like transporter family protein [Shimia sagamensis]
MPATGEAYALLAAFAYGLAGVSIVKGEATAQGDNGVFLAVVTTACLSAALWLAWGEFSLNNLMTKNALIAVAAFAAAGLFSTVLGRITMYRATEQIGAVTTGLLRRLTPVFALPLAFVVVGQMPHSREVLGGLVVLLGIVFYLYAPNWRHPGLVSTGLALGITSAFFYALSYALRSWALERLPDPALGALIGALIGCIWFPLAAAMHPNTSRGPRSFLIDRGLWHWITALALSFGQVLQFLALQSTSVLAVSVIGSLDVLFSAALIIVFRSGEPIAVRRLMIAALLAIMGITMMLTVPA